MTRKLHISCSWILGLILAFSALLPSDARAGQTPQVQLADSLYAKGEYSNAAEAYFAIAQVDGVSAPLYFNMANAYAQSGDLGKAVLYYARAHRLDPSDKEIRNNLNYFASKVEDANRAELRGKKTSVSPDPETFFGTAHRLIAEDVSSDTWAVAAVVAFILFLGGVAVYLFCSNVTLRKGGFFGGICLFFLAIFFIVFSYMGASAYDNHDEAVLQAYKAQLLIEPSEDAKPAASQLCQGTRFLIVAEETDVEGRPTWYKVRVNSSIEGWIPSSAIEII